MGTILAKLDALNATLTAIQGDIMEIQTALGELEVKIDDVNATLTDLIITSKNELMALIETKAGEIQAKLEAVNATIIDVLSDEMGDYYALLNTTLGEIEVKLDTIKDWLTQMNATLVEIREDVAVIKARSDTILARLDAINASLTDLIITSKNEIIALVESEIGDLRARLEAINATIISIITDRMEEYYALINTTLGEIEVKLDTLKDWLAQLNATIVDIEGDVATIRAGVSTILARLDALDATLTDIQGDIAVLDTTLGEIKAELDALAEDVETILSILGEWTGGVTAVAGYKVLALTTSELKGIWAEGTVVKISLYAPEAGRLHLIIPKALLEALGVGIDAVDVVLGWSEVDYEVVDLGASYMLVISYGPGDHTFEVYLTGAPIYRTLTGISILALAGAAVVGAGLAAYYILVRRRS
ncbi:MAG TPA: hypothetical protein ENF34_01330 [Candidatus Bathyarchaeota archaeon]|nr:hypothetical protein [Candidatus Bathyarchaeota archaeon]